jgi:hypothetical protein
VWFALIKLSYLTGFGLTGIKPSPAMLANELWGLLAAALIIGYARKFPRSVDQASAEPVATS